MFGLNLLYEFSRSRLGKTHRLGLLWTTDRPVAETSTRQQTTNGQTSMLPAGFEPALPTEEWPQTEALDRAATGIDYFDVISQHIRREPEECNKTAYIEMSRSKDSNPRPPE